MIDIQKLEIEKIKLEKVEMKAKIVEEKQEYIDKVMEAAEEDAIKVKEKLQIDIGKEYNEKHTKAMDVLKNEIVEKSDSATKHRVRRTLESKTGALDKGSVNT